MNTKSLSSLTVIALLVSTVLSATNNLKYSRSNLKQTDLNSFESDSPKKLTVFQNTITIFGAGFLDKSFFLTTILATKYNKYTVCFASTASLVFMGVLSIIAGAAITNYVPTFVIDCLATLMFFIVGTQMLVKYLSNECQKGAFVEANEDITTSSRVEGKNKIVKESLETFSLVSLAELGDKSQITEVYLSVNSTLVAIIYGIIISSFLLSLVAVCFGKFSAERLSVRTMNLFAAITFFGFGFFGLYNFVAND